MSVDSSDGVEFDDWVLERILGCGTFGKVLLFKNKENGDLVAVKKGHPEILANNLNGWKMEIETLHNLNHPGIVRALHLPDGLLALSKSDFPFLCMEYCSGGDLRQVLREPLNCCGLPERDVLDVLQNIGSAISYLHSLNIVHRDLKPENVVIQPADKRKVYKLIDLGYARDVVQQSLCQTVVGTLQYIAPELLLTDRYSCTVDYWSFGLVVHECATGVRPFLPGLPPIQWMRQVEAKSFEEICVYRDGEGQVVFSRTLFNENHLNSITKTLLEDWLRLMLDFDPIRRGGPQAIAFDKLKSILKTEIVSILWVDKLVHLSYAVGDTLTISILQNWIAQDTGIDIQNQLILLPRGNRPDSEKSARMLLNGTQESLDVYLFSKVNGDNVCRISEKYPNLMDAMLSNPRAEAEYQTQKRMWAQSTYFINQQAILYKKLLNALKVHSAYVALGTSRLKQQMSYLAGVLRHVTSCYELFAVGSSLDQHNYQLQSKRGGLPSDKMLEKWANEEIMLNKTLVELQSRSASTDQALNTVTTHVHDSAKIVGDFLANSTDTTLETCSKHACDLYTSIQKRPKEQRLQTDSNVPMTKTVVKVLKKRNELFTACFTQIRMVEKCSLEIDALSSILFSFKNELDQFLHQVIITQSQRQNDIWTLLERAVTMWQRTSMMNESYQSGSTSMISLPNFLMADPSGSESSAAIRENQALRYKIQDILSRGLTTKVTNTDFLDG